MSKEFEKYICKCGKTFIRVKGSNRKHNDLCMECSHIEFLKSKERLKSLFVEAEEVIEKLKAKKLNNNNTQNKL